MRLTLVLLAALGAAPALAAEPPDADAPVATASDQTSATAAQIDAWLRSSPAAEARAGAAMEPPPVVSDRRPHGVVSVGVGTHGYRSVYARTDLPLGESGRLSIAVADARFGGRWGGAYRYGPGAPSVGLGASLAERRRCDLEAMGAARPGDVAGAPDARCADPLSGW